jgi:hypothetical protein
MELFKEVMVRFLGTPLVGFAATITIPTSLRYHMHSRLFILFHDFAPRYDVL